MGRWARSKELARASWALLRHDKELMILPLISGLASLIIAGSFLFPIFLTASTTTADGAATLEPTPISYALMFLMYLVLAYVAIFFKAALLCGADERMRGGNPTLGSSLAGAGQRAGKILPWALVSATVSMILRSLEERAGLLGRIVIGLVGMAWAAVTFLVLPIVVFENISVGQAIKRSALMLKQTWGENLIVNIGIGLVAALLMLPAVVVVALGIATGAPLAIGVTIALAVVWGIGVSCWGSAMTGVFQLALYRYAVQQELPVEFATVDLSQAFAPRGAVDLVRWAATIDRTPRSGQRRGSGALVVAGLGGFGALGEDHLHRVGRLGHGDVELGTLGLAGPTQHVVGALLPTGRLPDADAHPHEVVALQVRLDRLEAVVAGQPPADLHLQLPGREVHLVVDDHELVQVVDAVALEQQAHG